MDGPGADTLLELNLNWLGAGPGHCEGERGGTEHLEKQLEDCLSPAASHCRPAVEQLPTISGAVEDH